MKHKVKEAIPIKQRTTSMNRDQGWAATHDLWPDHSMTTICAKSPPMDDDQMFRDQDLLKAGRNVAIIPH